MATAVKFAGANKELMPPTGAENISSLHTYTNGMCSVSCWHLSPDELAEVIRTGRVFVSVFSGSSQPPIFVGGEDNVRSVVVDYGGVWARGKGDSGE
ncbi:hypothetical protein [Brucella pseudogrignonensis]|uniref:hypothetical protein n=1 Tax=Brucella pseudogrignonensis TaxID=419475 RepID=UPI003BA09777